MQQSKRVFFAIQFSLLLLFAQFAVAAPISYEGLVGKWRLEKLDPSGLIMIRIEVEIKPDHTFTASTFANDAPKSRYEGTCELKGNELVWTYVNSGGELPPNFQDIDIIRAIKKTRFIYTSKSTDEAGIYNRIE